MKKNNINTVINANAKGNNVMNNEAHLVFPYEYNKALAAKNRHNENKVALADAMDRHNGLDLDGLRCKANNLCLNMLRKGNLSGYTRADVSKIIAKATLIDLTKCENQSGFNTDKLLMFVSREIAKAKKDARICVVVAVYEVYELNNELFNEKKERVMFTTREIAGHGWCVFDAKTGIMVRENLTWCEVMEFAVRMNLPCREYDRENDEVILY